MPEAAVAAAERTLPHNLEAERSVFVIDKGGVVRHREVLDDARNEPNYDKITQTLASL